MFCWNVFLYLCRMHKFSFFFSFYQKYVKIICFIWKLSKSLNFFCCRDRRPVPCSAPESWLPPWAYGGRGDGAPLQGGRQLRGSLRMVPQRAEDVPQWSGVFPQQEVAGVRTERSRQRHLLVQGCQWSRGGRQWRQLCSRTAQWVYRYTVSYLFQCYTQGDSEFRKDQTSHFEQILSRLVDRNWQFCLSRRWICGENSSFSDVFSSNKPIRVRLFETLISKM